MKNLPVNVVTLTLGLACSGLISNGAPLVVNPSSDASTLVNSIIGSGLTVVGTPTYSGANSGSSGTFSGGLDLIGISSGLLMTTGNAVGAIGPNFTEFYGGVGTTSSLKFDFVTSGGDLSIDYVFASEEYPEFINFSKDVFQLRLNGVNIAKVPGTALDVSVENVNAVVNSSYFNINYFENPNVDLQYNGFTDVFTASVMNLAAGQHTIEFFIDDAGDDFADSAVFIQTIEFSETQVPPGGSKVPDTGSTLVFMAVCATALVTFRRRTAGL